jgi:ADP-ribose pyrophosphatase YjhB (NUDIX family)
MVTDTAVFSKVLDWAQRLQAIAQTGLAYEEQTEYDRYRYEQVRGIAAEMLARGDGHAEAELVRVFASQMGHATPKLDVRGVVFRDEEILLVRERADRRWTLPGGWADVGEGPSDAVTREVQEESGYRTRAVKLLALYDRDQHGHPPHPWHAWKAVLLCERLGEEQRPLGPETLAVDFFPRDRLPELSLSRVTPRQIARFFEHREHPEWPADFD